MSKSKKTARHSHRRVTSNRAAPTSPSESLLFSLVKLLVGMLLVARLLVPTEASVHGQTLWMVQLWFLAAAVWAWDCIREREVRVRFGLVDFFLWLVVIGHVVAAGFVFVGEGQKRMALNMLWEWVGLGVSLFLVRQTLRTVADVRRLVIVLVTVTASLAVVGLWQHYVWYPETTDWFSQLTGELTELESADGTADRGIEVARQMRIREIQTELAQQGVPSEGPARAMWESRLSQSREPFGFFALANTFAGLLVVALMFAIGLVAARRRGEGGIRSVLFPMICVALIGFCLVLTKSRTAWLGLGAGLMSWGCVSIYRAKWDRGRIHFLQPLMVILVLVAGVGAAFFTGGLDRQVVSEAGKSLEYRFQYWTGALQVVRESPVWGVGPGNFRQHYLKYKLPESSEEIFEPHNFILDVWTSGGVIAVIGMAGLMIFSVLRACRWRKDLSAAGVASSSASQPPGLWNPLTRGAILGFVIVLGIGDLLGGEFDLRLLVGMAISIGFMILAATSSAKSVSISDGCLAGGFIALMVHLLGAGGIEMPAIVQTMVILSAIATLPMSEVKMSKDVQPRQINSVLCPIVVGVVSISLFACCLQSATLPVIYREALVGTGDAVLTESHDLKRAEAYYREAAQRDVFSPEPLLRLAELYHGQSVRPSRQSDRRFSQAVKMQNLAIQRNPLDPQGFRQLGNWYLQRFETTGQREDAQFAAEKLKQAVERYPASAVLRAEWAESLDKLGMNRRAFFEAKEALRLDAINRREGHSDKWLPQGVLENCRRIAAFSGNPTKKKNQN